MTLSEWKREQKEKDILRLVKLAVKKPITATTAQPPTHTQRPPLEDQALKYLKAIRDEVGASWKHDSTPADIKKDLDAWVAAGGNAQGIMQRINDLLPFWTMYYTIQDFSASDMITVPQPDSVTYGDSPAVANGWTQFLAASEESKYRMMEDA